jgi:hypothetical protein
MKRGNFNNMIFALLALALISACQKNPVTGPDSNQNNEARNRKVTHLIKEFKTSLVQKSGGTMTTDSSVWYLEGLLNLEQANNLHNFSDLNFFKDSIILTPVDGTFTLDQVNLAYIQFTTTLQAMVAQQNNQYYQIDLADIRIIPTGLKDGSVEIELNGSGGTSGYINYLPFGTTDYWYWGWDDGKCSSYQGQGLGTDAADLLQYKFNHPLSAGQGGYFTDIDLYTVLGEDFPSDPSNPGPYCDYIIFCYFSPIPIVNEPCLSPEELNFYLSKFDNVKASLCLIGKTFRNVEVLDDIVIGMPNSRVHNYWLYYGLLTASSE